MYFWTCMCICVCACVYIHQTHWRDFQRCYLTEYLWKWFVLWWVFLECHESQVVLAFQLCSTKDEVGGRFMYYDSTELRWNHNYGTDCSRKQGQPSIRWKLQNINIYSQRMIHFYLFIFLYFSICNLSSLAAVPGNYWGQHYFPAFALRTWWEVSDGIWAKALAYFKYV